MYTTTTPNAMTASGFWMGSELDRCPSSTGQHFIEAVTRRCANTIYPVGFSESHVNATFHSPAPLSASTTPVTSFLALTLIASIAVVSAIVWLGTTQHSHVGVEERQKKAARGILQKQLSQPARRWKENKTKNHAARSIQTSWRQQRAIIEQERELSAPTMLSLFGGNDPYRVSAPRKAPITHVQYRLDDESSSSSSLPDLIDHKASRRKHSFRGILLGLTLFVLLARCVIITDDPWNTVERFSNNLEQLTRKHAERFSMNKAVEDPPLPKRGAFDCDGCKSYRKALGGAYGPVVPF